jgi:hypothetical protein
MGSAAAGAGMSEPSCREPSQELAEPFRGNAYRMPQLDAGNHALGNEFVYLTNALISQGCYSSRP